MKNIKLTKDEIKSKNMVLLIGMSFFFIKFITFIDGCELFYVAMLLYFGCEFANYILTRKVTGMHSLYVSLACLIASVSGLKYMNEPSNMVLSITLASWMIIMIVIKLFRIEELRSELNNSVFINIFSMSLFILLGFLVVTNLYLSISNEALMLGFFFVANGILNIIETVGNIKFCK